MFETLTSITEPVLSVVSWNVMSAVSEAPAMPSVTVPLAWISALAKSIETGVVPVPPVGTDSGCPLKLTATPVMLEPLTSTSRFVAEIVTPGTPTSPMWSAVAFSA